MNPMNPTLKKQEKKRTGVKASRFTRRINANREAAEQDRMRLGLERGFRSKLTSMFHTIGRVGKAEVMKTGSANNTIASIEQRVKKVLESHYRKTIIMFANRADAGNQVKRRTRHQQIINDYISQRGGDNIQAITSTMRDRIRTIINAGQVAGSSERVIGNQIRSLGAAYGGNRAFTIARTETNTAANFAADQIDRENRGSAVDNRMKRWVSVNDDRTRGHHVLMNGVQVPVDSNFEVPYRGNTYSMSVPGDPEGGAGNVINCRCICIYIDDDTLVRQDGTTTEGTEDYKRWGPGVEKDEFDYHQTSWFRNMPEVLRKAIQEADPLSLVEYKPGYGASYSDEFGDIVMQSLPGAEYDDIRDYYLDQRTWRHEFAHHLDAQREGGRGLWSETVIYEILEDAALYTDDFIAASQVASTAEIEALGIRLSNGGKVTLKEINKQLATSGMNGRDLLRMLPDLRTAKPEVRLAEMYRASSSIKHKDWTTLEKFLSAYDSERGDWSSMSDFIEALTDAKLGQGHDYEYYHRRLPTDEESGYTADHTGEAWAEYVALIGGRNRTTWTRLMTHFAPQTTNGFKTLVEVIAYGE